MPTKSILVRPIVVALVLATLAACSSPFHEPNPAVGSADKAAQAANRDALKGFSSSKTPAWETRQASEKPGSLTPWEETKTKEAESHE